MVRTFDWGDPYFLSIILFIIFILTLVLAEYAVRKFIFTSDSKISYIGRRNIINPVRIIIFISFALAWVEMDLDFDR